MKSRKEELERKRQKLAELRRSREERKNALLNAQKKETTASAINRDRKAIDELVASLVGDISSVSSINSLSARSNSSSPNQPELPNSTLSSPSLSPNVAQPTSAELPPTPVIRKEKPLESSEIVIFDFPPTIVYNKEIQTTEVYEEPTEKEETDNVNFESEILEPEVPVVKEVIKEEKITEFSEEEKKNIMQTEGFKDFFDYSTKIVERALDEPYDIMIDYRVDNTIEDNKANDNTLKLVQSFFSEEWTKDRTVTDIDWSPEFSELMLGSYNKKKQSLITDPYGVCCIWNLHLQGRPEFIFQTQSDITSACFSKFHPKLVIGGTYSGQIVLWDMRTKSLPVQKTPLTVTGHAHPIYKMQMVGTQNSNNLISASSDGIVCSWQLDMLTQPQEIIELVSSSNDKISDIAITTFDFPDNEISSFWIGTEEGRVHQVNRYERADSKAGLNATDRYEGHGGIITGLSFHPQSAGSYNFSNLFLTSSIDWTVKLWRTKSTLKPSIKEEIIQPICSFDYANDYVLDVEWSPVHPAMFASVDGDGQLNIFNINQDQEMPIYSMTVDPNHSLNKLKWHKDGKKISVGSSDGHIYVYDIGDLSIPSTDENGTLQKTLQEL
ncbi:WD40 repeat-like protein [Neocallimastix lanati (nom. inval.)]|jgi:dynein intermediate chain|nr:WD40 repeat-like protein [Neocallimastix sp. JGI-2020a]